MSPLPSRLRALVLFAVASLAGWLHAAPTITQQPQATVIVTSGQAAVFSAQATGTGPIRWQWRRMGGALTGQTGPTLTLPAATMAEVGFYDVVVTDDAGSTTSRPCRVLVTPVGGYPNTLRLDTSFAPLFELDGATIDSIAVAPNGMVYVCGNFTHIAGQPRAGLARFSADLVLDSSYAPAAASSLFGLLAQPDGKILFRGSVRLADGRIVGPLGRLNSDGSLDESFAAAEFRQSRGLVSIGDLALQPDGKILVAGSFDSVNSLARSALTRLNTEGTVDLTFNPDLGAEPSITSVLVSHDKIVLLGIFKPAPGTNHQLIRLTSDGSRDTTFTQSSLARDFYRPLVVDPAGQIYAAASFNAGTFPKTSAFVRLLDDGTIDPSYQCALDSVPRNARAMPDGRIAVIEDDTYPKYSYGVLSTTGALEYSHSTTANSSTVRLSVLAAPGKTCSILAVSRLRPDFHFPEG
ncbi:MAG: hypothetical protein IPL39_07755 [Opitutaceae bacterium]|nr:hypothetical protein [Opitutaceae bacterium]